MKRIGAAFFLFLASGAAAAQDYPAKPVVIIVPAAAGGPTDTLTRVLAGSMGEALKQQMIVENAGGAGGTIGVTRAAKARADGYTLLLYHIGMATTPTLYRHLRFNPLTDFEYIGLINEVPMTIIANEKVPAKNLKEFLAYLRANKDKVSYANAGIGAASHLCGMLFMSAIQLDLLTVPYKGTGPAMNDLLGGQVTFMCDPTTTTTSQIKGGKVKVYGITSAKRVASLPDVPTLEEQGLKGANVGVWHGLYAPKGTPKPVLDKLVSALQEAMKDEGVNKRFSELGAVSFPADKQTPAALQAHLKAEIDKWAPLIKKAGQYAD
jgi:tripartite-type tricarboxylate transporter receptor subunit TctC